LNRSVKPGEGVCIRRETFEGKVCYGIHSEDGQRIGYVPREMLRILESRRIVEAHVVSTREFGVPWHRYRIRLTTVVSL
jgi:putative IMPACT (imprinted ancient) family translation regulator